MSTEIIDNIEFDTALSQRYLAYALSTIMSRSLPDVRDGLKPVHRRLLYAMRQLNLNPSSGFKKCARVVGDVIGKYHPHGDVAVYETLVRLAQLFTLRYPLIEGQGNFGSIDGDNAAAMRYTESRLSQISGYLLGDLDEDTVDFKSTYDDQDQEPVVLPASFPNLLANGSEGIAVGMATAIPPHNVHELCEALLFLIKHKDASIKDLMQFIPGPDFPTGGIITEDKETIISAYESGKGSFRLRATWHKEELNHGAYQIIITQIPYQVQKSKLIEKIADLFKEKKLLMLANIQDESAEDIRIVLEPKNRSIDPELIMQVLFKLSDLEIRYNMNLNVLDAASSPQVMNLKQILEAFLTHRYEVVQRRTKFRLKILNSRLEILQGLIIAYLNLDEVINIIRKEDEPKEVLMQKFNLSDNQAEAILNMRLKNLRLLEETSIRRELDELLKTKATLELIIADHKVCLKVIEDDLKNIQQKFGISTALGKRRTKITGVTPMINQITAEDFITKEAVTISYSKMGWIKLIKSHDDEAINIKYKEADSALYLLKCYTTDKLIIFSNKGRIYTIVVDKLSRNKSDSIRLLIDLESNEEIITMFIYQENTTLLLVSKNGKGFLTSSIEVLASTKAGKQILSLTANDEAFACKILTGDAIAIIGSNRKLLIFMANELPLMKKGQGVQLQKYHNGAISDIKSFNLAQGLCFKPGGKPEMQLITWLNKRGSSGKLPPVGFNKNNTF
jgi:topoisomerase-4 subunit A